MATYQQIAVLAETGGSLLSLMKVAVLIAADTVRTEDVATPNHAARLDWAKRAFLQTDRSQEYATRMLRLLLARNGAFVDAAVAGTLTDAQIQAAVDSMVNPFANQGL